MNRVLNKKIEYKILQGTQQLQQGTKTKSIKKSISSGTGLRPLTKYNNTEIQTKYRKHW